MFSRVKWNCWSQKEQRSWYTIVLPECFSGISILLLWYTFLWAPHGNYFAAYLKQIWCTCNSIFWGNVHGNLATCVSKSCNCCCSVHLWPKTTGVSSFWQRTTNYEIYNWVNVIEAQTYCVMIALHFFISVSLIFAKLVLVYYYSCPCLNLQRHNHNWR